MSIKYLSFPEIDTHECEPRIKGPSFKYEFNKSFDGSFCLKTAITTFDLYKLKYQDESHQINLNFEQISKMFMQTIGDRMYVKFDKFDFVSDKFTFDFIHDNTLRGLQETFEDGCSAYFPLFGINFPEHISGIELQCFFDVLSNQIGYSLGNGGDNYVDGATFLKIYRMSQTVFPHLKNLESYTVFPTIDFSEIPKPVF